jgi:hypothetical protein
MKKRKCLFLFVSIIIFTASCKKEDRKNLPYIGTWQTDVYTVAYDEPGSLFNRRMVFVFEDNSFSDTVYHVIGNLEQPILAVEGMLEPLDNSILHLSITRMGEILGTWIDWDSAGTQGFDSLQTEYLDPLLPVDFEAAYSLDQNQLNLIISGTNDTLKLVKL